MNERAAWSRRDLLRTGVGLSAVLGLSGLAGLREALAAGQGDDPWRGGQLLGQLPFQAEPPDPLHTRIADGLDERLYTDLSLVDRDRLITPVEEFFVRTGVPDQLDRSRPWRIRIDGLVRRPLSLSAANLEPRVQDMGVHHIECAGNSRATRFGLISTAEWSGVRLSRMLAGAGPLSTAKAVRITGFDGHTKTSTNSSAGCAWIYTPEQLSQAGAFLATRMNGKPLTPDHGFPVRLVVPGWYGCCCIKWVNRIELVDADQPATSQMREFAARTFQNGVPTSAADYQPATVDRAAMPVRVEKWRVDGKIRYRVVGIDWGGDRTKGRLQIRFRPRDPFVPVSVQPAPPGGGWGVWSHHWAPSTPGPGLIQLELDEKSVPTRRMSAGMYLRAVMVDQV
ncbi:MAG: molybdopterin-dependent oxidoreductase [bacterium]|nr:molybdopterin-dependent oxidoreductase [bacterium]